MCTGHISIQSSASQASLERTLSYRRTNIQKNIEASRKLNTTSQKKFTSGIYICIEIYQHFIVKRQMDLPLTIHHHRQHGFVYSYHGYWEFGEGLRIMRRGGNERQNMQHLTPKTKAFLTGIFFFFLSFNKYDPMVILRESQW